jgi:hypothetical protein
MEIKIQIEEKTAIKPGSIAASFPARGRKPAFFWKTGNAFVQWSLQSRV